VSEVQGGESTALLYASAAFYRAHGLGNDYLVFERGESASGWLVSPGAIQEICHRGRGAGSDGLVILLDSQPRDRIYPLRMFNPDGTEFERSGNGLRVLASYLYRAGRVGRASFEVRSGGSTIPITVHEATPLGSYDVSVVMGAARVGLDAVDGDASALDSAGHAVHPTLGPVAFVPVSVGNPHAVVFPEPDASAPIDDVGPFLSKHRAFPRGVNVQIADVPAPDRMRIAIWERGVGRTSASGTSACASVVAAVHTGRLRPGRVVVEMEGGRVRVSVTPDLEVTLRGPVEDVEEGLLTVGLLRRLAEAEEDSGLERPLGTDAAQ
jgi:diaminopimelate epimerase